MRAPYYKQELWFSCFATCVKMILEYYGIKKSERDLRILLKTTPRFGTIWGEAEREIKKLGFELKHKNMPYEELENLVKSGVPVIASIDIESEDENVGHVGVVVDVENDSVVFHDPEKGIVTFSRERFSGLWKERRYKAGYLKKI